MRYTRILFFPTMLISLFGLKEKICYPRTVHRIYKEPLKTLHKKNLLLLKPQYNSFYLK